MSPSCGPRLRGPRMRAIPMVPENTARTRGAKGDDAAEDGGGRTSLGRGGGRGRLGGSRGLDVCKSVASAFDMARVAGMSSGRMRTNTSPKEKTSPSRMIASSIFWPRT
jgi:hypothetical protein